MVTPYYTTTDGADLQGPVTELQFIASLQAAYETPTWFANRLQSSYAANQLSYLSRGWIVAQLTPGGVTLWDSIQSPESYMWHLTGDRWVAGHHERDLYWFKVPAQVAGASSTSRAQAGGL